MQPIEKEEPGRQLLLKIDKVNIASALRSLESFFDTHDFPRIKVSQFVASQTRLISEKNIVQLLWFGANVNHVDRGTGRTALFNVILGGIDHALRLILKAEANVNFLDDLKG